MHAPRSRPQAARSARRRRSRACTRSRRPTEPRRSGTPTRRRAARTTRCRPCGASYTDPVNQAQLVHNLEHGGVAIQYGSDVPAATVQQLKAFVQDHPRGTVVAPYPVPRRPDRARRVGDRERRRSRRRAPRTLRSARASTRRPSSRSSTRTSSEGPSASRPTRSYPGGPSRLAPGWRNWSDAVGLKPTVPRDIWVRLPAPALVLVRRAGFRRSGIPRLDPSPSARAHP